MRKSITGILFGAMLFMISCGQPDTKPSEGSKIGFALSFLRSTNDYVPAGENLIVSPYSAGVIFSMLEEGADGQTKAEFDDALNGCLFKADDLGGGGDVNVKSANSVWISDDFSIRNHYVSLLAKDYDAFITTQNFSDPATVKAINNWCSEHTEGKIDEIIDELGSNDVLVLVNALYFKAPWEIAFDINSTSDGIFHGTSGDETVPMMASRADYRYAEYEGFQLIELPYRGDRYSMYVALPPAGKNIDTYMPYLNESVYQTAISQMTEREVILKMPKFKLETAMLLNDPMEKMGIRTAFSGAADFREIAATGPLALSIVKQKCYIDVTEEGTEAAAVTSAQVRLTSLNRDPVPKVTVDRPFVFFISDSQTGNILFAGKVVNIHK